jgi:hypothetical protein
MKTYSKTIIDCIDDKILQSELNIQFELIEEYNKELAYHKYYGQIYQEENGTPQPQPQQQLSQQQQNPNLPQQQQQNPNNQSGGGRSFADMWNSNTGAFEGRAGESMFIKILKFLPRLIRNVVKSIISGIQTIFSTKNEQETEKAKQDIQAFHPTSEQLDEMVAEMNKVSGQAGDNLEEAFKHFKKGKLGSAGEDLQDAGQNAKSAISTGLKVAGAGIAGAFGLVTTFLKVNNVQDSKEFFNNVYDNGLLPASNLIGLAPQTLTAVKKGIDTIKNHAKLVAMKNENKRRLKDETKKVSADPDRNHAMQTHLQQQSTQIKQELEQSRKTLEQILPNVMNSIGRFSAEGPDDQRGAEYKKNTKEVFDLMKSLGEAGDLLSQVFQMITGNHTAESYETDLCDSRIYHEAAGLPGPDPDEEEDVSMLQQSMNMVKTIQNILQKTLEAADDNMSLIQAFGIIANWFMNNKAKKEEKLINKGIQMGKEQGYRQAMGEDVPDEPYQKKPGLFSRMFNRNKNNNQT